MLAIYSASHVKSLFLMLNPTRSPALRRGLQLFNRVRAQPARCPKSQWDVSPWDMSSSTDSNLGEGHDVTVAGPS